MHDLDLHGVARIGNHHLQPKIIRNNVISNVPKIEKGSQKIIGVLAIYPDGNKVSFSIKNRFTVSWGDGTTQNFNSGALATHSYCFDDLINIPLNPKGYKEVIVTILVRNRYNLTEINFDPEEYAEKQSSWLSLDISAPKLNKLVLSSGKIKNKHPLLEHHSVVN